jgi:O-succinylbenzoic acid--CoA ligase
MEALAAALDGSGPAILPLDPTLPRARLDELIEAFAPASIETSEEFQRNSGAGRVLRAGLGRAAPGVDDDVAVVLATSGSTGLPKGAELTAAALTASATASLSRLGASPGERWLCCLPVHHISGLGVLVRSLLAGSTPVVTDRADVGVIVREAAQPGPLSRPGGGSPPGPGCHYISLVPTQLRRLLDAGAPLSGFRGILLGGAAAQPGLLGEAAAAGARVVTTYGMTETCGGCVYDGVPLDGVRVAAGGDGRIKLTGPVLFSRYRLAPELSRAALRDGWFVTSDLGELEDGRLVVRGRADDVINSGGEKVVAGEVEHVLRGCPGVRDAVVMGTPDPDWGERVTAMVVAADPADPPGLDEIRAHVTDRLPRYAAPRAMLLVAGLPMLPSGKPDRQLIRDIALREG